MDINDNSPEFVPKPSELLSAYIRSIDEGSGSVGMVVVDVNATDRDSGPNAEIRYSISGDENGYFKIDSFTVCAKILIYIQFSLVCECCQPSSTITELLIRQINFPFVFSPFCQFYFCFVC